MKIGIETSAISKNLTGTGRYINCLLEQLGTTGHEIITFSPQKHTNNSTRQILNVSGKGLQKHIYRQFRLAGEMRAKGIDYGIFPDYFIPPGFNNPAAVVIHDLSFITHPQFYSGLFVNFYTRQLKETLKKKPVIITVSDNSRKQIHELLGISPDSIYVMQPYSDIKYNSSDIQRNQAAPYLLYVGHVEPRKNLSFLIENFIKWKRTNNVNMSLVITGEIWIESRSIKGLLKNYKDNPDITFTGYVEEAELDKLYNNAAGFVHTSLVEGFGLPVLEAMHYNLPVICSKGTATEEISGSGSIHIDPYNGESLLRGLDILYSKYINNEPADYKIKYSPSLMNLQLNLVLEALDSRLNSRVSPYSPAVNAEEAVEKTLLYASLFNSGITKCRLHSAIFDVKISKEKLDEALEKLVGKGIIIVKEGAAYLNTLSYDFYKRKTVNKKLKASLLFLKLLNALPFVSSIAFSGGTAHYGISMHNDIDLFIITRPHCLYPVYLFIHIFSFIFGLRDSICANYLIDENNLEIKSARDFYTAHQIISLKSFKKDQALDAFLSQNEWINNYFPNFTINKNSGSRGRGKYKFASPFNIAIMLFYKRLYRKKILEDKSESLKFTPGCLKLHTNDHRAKTSVYFESEWKKYRMKRNQRLQIKHAPVSGPELKSEAGA